MCGKKGTLIAKQKEKYPVLLLSCDERDMISVYAKEVGGSWFGLAYVGEEIVATAVDSTKRKNNNGSCEKPSF